MASEKENENNEEKHNRKIGTLIVKIQVAILICVLAAVLILLYLILPRFRTELSFVTAVIGASAVVCSAYYAALAVRMAVKQLETTITIASKEMAGAAELTKKQKSCDLLRDLHTEHMVKLRRFIERELDVEHKGNEELYNDIRADENMDLLIALGTCFGFWEDISIGIQNEAMDEKILYDSLSFILPNHFQKLRFFINGERSFYKDGTIYIEMQKLALAWSQQKSLLTGKPWQGKSQ